MHQTKRVIFYILLLLPFGCIKPYDPQIDSNTESKYVVSGSVTNIEGWHEVEVTKSTPVEKPGYIPVEGCQVTIEDDRGHTFVAEEYLPGHYHVWIDQAFLTPGNSYRARVVTPFGEVIESRFDKMPKGPSLDTVYYSILDLATNNPAVFHRVMQFYVDLDAQGDYSQFYKWDVIETWEYHAEHPLEYYYNGDWHRVDPPDYSKQVCYTTQYVHNLFTISTQNLSENKYTKYPLHYIDGNSSRLAYLYSMLVKQLALSEKAYNYWDQLRINSNEQGGLYEKQPLAIKGNIKNLSAPEKEVLGYFFAASESSHRYFYKDVEGITLDYYNNCFEDELGRGGWRQFRPSDYPVYYTYISGALRILTPNCIDCRLSGGTTLKPIFWPR